MRMQTRKEGSWLTWSEGDLPQTLATLSSDSQQTLTPAPRPRMLLGPELRNSWEF